MNTLEKELTEEEKQVKALEAELAAEEMRAVALDKSVAKLTRQLREQKRINADNERHEKLMAEHGEENIARIRTQIGSLYLKRGAPELFELWQNHLSAQGKLDKDYDNGIALSFIKGCRLDPEPSAFDRILEEQPACLNHCLAALSRLYGGLQLF